MLTMQANSITKTTKSKKEGKAYLSLDDGGISPHLEKSWRKDQDNMSAIDSGISDCSADSEADRMSLWSERDSLYSEKSSDRKSSCSTDMHSKMITPQQTNQSGRVCRPKTVKKPEMSSRSILRQYGLQSQKLSQSPCNNKENRSNCGSKNGLSNGHSIKDINNTNSVAEIQVDSMFNSPNSSQLYFPKRKQKSRVLRAATLYQF